MALAIAIGLGLGFGPDRPGYPSYPPPSGYRWAQVTDMGVPVTDNGFPVYDLERIAA